MPKKEKNEQELKKYTDMLNVEFFKTANGISLKIFSALRAYEKDYKKALENNALNNDDLPSLQEVMFAIKNKLAETALEDNDILMNGGKYSDFIKEYLADPVNALKKQQDFLIDDYSKKDLPYYKGTYPDDFDFAKAKADADYLKMLVKENENNYYEYVKDKKDIWKEDQNLNVDWFKVYFKNDSKKVDEILEDNKGGFFENFFGTTSEEYKCFAKSFKDFLSDTSDKGNIKLLNNTALNYLEHKLPSFDRLSEEFDERDLEKLDSTGKGRVMLCLNTLKAINLACDAMSNDLKLQEHKKNDIVDLQADFHNKVQEEVKMPDELDKAVILDESNEIENNNIINDEINEVEK